MDPQTVLIIEDDFPTRKLMQLAVRQAGHHAIGASDGRRGLSILFDNQEISLVISDVEMPNQDGRAVVREIRRWREFDRTPIVLCSAVVRISEISDLMELGVSRFLPKPFRVDELRETITRLLESRKKGQLFATRQATETLTEKEEKCAG